MKKGIITFRFSAIVFIIINPFFVKGQIESPFNYGANSLGLGNAAVAADGHYAILYNQAGIAELDQLSFSFDAAQLFNNSGVSHFHAGMVIPTKKYGNFGLKIQNYGLEGYQYQNYAFTYARLIFKNFKIATTFNLYQFRIEDYGNTFVPNVDIGLISKYNEKLSFGAHIANPLPLNITEKNSFPTVFSLGIMYKISTLVHLNVDFEKNISQKENIKLGINYKIHPKLDLRAGINTYPGSFHFGFSIHLQQLNIHLGNAYHPILGNSSGIGIQYSM